MIGMSACEALINDWAQLLREAGPGQVFSIQGGGTKPALQPRPALALQPGSTAQPVPGGTNLTGETRQISTTALSGIIEYCPAEFTITAYAGTPVSQVLNVLREHGQYLPFESPYHVPTGPVEGESGVRRHLAERTTLGGLLAAGINGPGRLRHGGLRDFVLEVRYLDGQGIMRRGGRRVVKNAAGFDIPKLMVGSCGRLGVLLDVTLKVFPQPRDYLTLHLMSENIDSTVEILTTLQTHPWDLDAIEIQLDGSILARFAGYAEALIKHGQRIQSRLSRYYSSFLTGTQQQQVWSTYADWLWGRPEECLVKVPIALRKIFDLDEDLDEMEIQRAYGSGGNVAWLQWSTAPESQAGRLRRLHRLLLENGLTGQVLQGPSPQLLWGAQPGAVFRQRLKSVFDPQGRLGSY